MSTTAKHLTIYSVPVIVSDAWATSVNKIEKKRKKKNIYIHPYSTYISFHEISFIFNTEIYIQLKLYRYSSMILVEKAMVPHAFSNAMSIILYQLYIIIAMPSEKTMAPHSGTLAWKIP